MSNDRHQVGLPHLARQLGAAQGEAFDHRLREYERSEREERLSRFAWAVDGEDGEEPGGQPEHRQTSLPTLELEREVQRLTAYYNAVQGSRAWRLTQRLRRLVGREW